MYLTKKKERVMIVQMTLEKKATEGVRLSTNIKFKGNIHCAAISNFIILFFRSIQFYVKKTLIVCPPVIKSERNER